VSLSLYITLKSLLSNKLQFCSILILSIYCEFIIECLLEIKWLKLGNLNNWIRFFFLTPLKFSLSCSPDMLDCDDFEDISKSLGTSDI